MTPSPLTPDEPWDLPMMDGIDPLQRIAAANTRRELDILIDEMGKPGSGVPREYIRTAFNKYYLLSENEDDEGDAPTGA
jgi:hypothetical protein